MPLFSLSEMEINILVDKKNELKMEITGEGHTFLNMLKGELFSMPEVTSCGYRREHPLIDKTTFFLFTKKPAKTVLKKALKNLDKKLKAMKKGFK